MKSLRQLLEEAEHAVDTYKNPDISEARERLNQVLMAIGRGSTGDDEITSLRVYPQKVVINTRYSVRCCEQHAEFVLPVAVLDAPDPVQAALIWGLTKTRDEAAAKVRWDAQSLEGSQARLAEAEAKLKEAQP